MKNSAFRIFCTKSRIGILNSSVFFLMFVSMSACTEAEINAVTTDATTNVQKKNDTSSDDTNNPDNNDPTNPVVNDGSVKAQVNGPLTVIAGLRIPLDGSLSQNADEFTWHQNQGASLTVEDATAKKTYVSIPANAAVGTVYNFNFNVRGDKGSDSADLKITVIAPVFQKFADIKQYPGQPLMPSGLGFNSEGLWVVNFSDYGTTKVGSAVLVNPQGQTIRSYNITGVPDNSSFYTDGKLVITDPAKGLIEFLDTKTGAVTTVPGGTGIGASNTPLVDRSGNIWISDNIDKVYFYDVKTHTNKVWLSGLSYPKGMSFGPESDAIYIGIRGGVKRVHINADNSPGKSEDYLSTGKSCGVDGVTFDEGQNMYVGCVASPHSILYIVPYRASGASAPSRTFLADDTGQTDFWFIYPRFGTAAFGDTTLYFANIGPKTLGRLKIGLKTLVQPRAPAAK